MEDEHKQRTIARKPIKECFRCGRCCVSPTFGGFDATLEDVKRWKGENRNDILERVEIGLPNGNMTNGTAWNGIDEIGVGGFGINPRTLVEESVCPFLKKENDGNFSCGIQETKPQVCKDFLCDAKFMEVIIDRQSMLVKNFILIPNEKKFDDYFKEEVVDEDEPKIFIEKDIFHDLIEALIVHTDTLDDFAEGEERKNIDRRIELLWKLIAKLKEFYEGCNIGEEREFD